MNIFTSLIFVFALLLVGVCQAETKTEHWPNGQKMLEANLKDGQLHGRTTRWYANGQKRDEQNYKNANQHGLEINWRKNGQKWHEVNFKDGDQHGLEIYWHKNGQKWHEVNFKDGDQHGLETRWYGNGQKKGEANFQDGKLMTSTVWLPDGSKCPLSNVRDGNGVLFDYDKNGKKWSKTNYKNGEEHGLSTEWNENGNVINKTNYVNGEKVADLDDATVMNLKQMFLLLYEYALDDGKYPDDLEVLHKTNSHIDPNELDELSSCKIDDKKTKLIYYPGFRTASPANVILMHTPKPIDGKMAYLRNDGSVKTVAAEEFEELLKAQQ
ncbi:MAG: toxin-antitoxin system YwqK family antitoxin [Akkermansiaceae bacterium]|nr:toxin-antitoxin system YwqK family antitoxin [Akkermansiaceae bacterium]